ncbi:uncharacterized protein TrAtP1_001165 [Trichoderma atroviride]|uniref:uncharacterized protein n=1 Tax=Hypocrea atroviridis TaxID=63577 RepID=UPI0033278F01|nr:hypothetical protein TrAtP1_001165 [Trichoderma atroviride]
MLPRVQLPLGDNRPVSRPALAEASPLAAAQSRLPTAAGVCVDASQSSPRQEGGLGDGLNIDTKLDG